MHCKLNCDCITGIFIDFALATRILRISRMSRIFGIKHYYFVENFLRFFKDFPGNFVRHFINGFNKDLFQ